MGAFSNTEVNILICHLLAKAVQEEKFLTTPEAKLLKRK